MGLIQKMGKWGGASHAEAAGAAALRKGRGGVLSSEAAPGAKSHNTEGQTALNLGGV